MNRIFFISMLILMSLFSCKEDPSTKPENNPENTKETTGINIHFMDTNVRPQDDFFNYVNGEWIKQSQIPSDRSRWGSFDELRKKTDHNTLQLLKEAQKDTRYVKGSDERKALDYYASIMDTTGRNNAGLAPFKPYLEKIKALKTKDDIAGFMRESEPVLGSSFFSVAVRADMKNSTKNVLYITPAGFGLPDRDYYVATDDDTQKIRTQYKGHIARMFHFLGKTKSEIAQAQEHILNIETILAKAELTKEARRKPENVYHPMTVNELQKMMPHFDIKKFLKDLNIQVERLIVMQPEYMKTFSEVFKKQSVDAIKDYLTWNVFRGAAGELSTEISNANWEFYGKTLDGQPKRKPLEERALSTVNWTIGEAVGKLYVQKYFPAEAKNKAREMINYLQKAYKQRIAKLPWMSDETKQKAIHKVESLQIKIGYPDKWKDYSSMQIKSPSEGGAYFENSLAVSR